MLAASTPTPCPAAAPALVALPRRGAAALPWVLAEVAKAATEDEEVAVRPSNSAVRARTAVYTAFGCGARYMSFGFWGSLAGMGS